MKKVRVTTFVNVSIKQAILEQAKEQDRSESYVVERLIMDNIKPIEKAPVSTDWKDHVDGIGG